VKSSIPCALVMVLTYCVSVCAQSTRTSKRQALTLSQAVETVRPSVVQILFKTEVERPLGSGFIVSSEGCVVTADHVIVSGKARLAESSASGKHMVIGFPAPQMQIGGIRFTGNFLDSAFEIVEEDPSHDLALLRAERNPFKGQLGNAYRIGNKEIPLQVGIARLYSQRPKDGDHIAISGYPLQELVMVTTAGSIAAAWPVERALAPGEPQLPWSRSVDSLLADVTNNGGNSGGPVYLSETGEVVGVSEGFDNAMAMFPDQSPATISGQQILYNSGLSFFVPVWDIAALLKKNRSKCPGLAAQH
jgi:S1-C subfamily serine protease